MTTGSRPRTPRRSCRIRAAASVRPAAIAWPPKRLTIVGATLVTRSSVSRKCTPSIERPEPRSLAWSLRAKAIVGRWNFSLMREATSPTTPWCHDSSNRQIVARRRPRRRRVAASASSCMSLSISRRSRFSASSCCASASAALEVVGGQALDADRHVGQPSGRVDAWADRKAEIVERAGARVAAGHLEQRRDARVQAAARIRCRPWRDQHAVVVDRAARRRRRCRARPGPAAHRAAAATRHRSGRVRAARRAAPAARRTSRRRRPDACSESRSPAGSD